MSGNKKVCIFPKAIKDLENIFAYSHANFGKGRAKKYIRDLNTAFNKLAKEPNLGLEYSDINQSLLAYKVVSHLIFFKASLDGITVIRVLHQSMNYEEHIP
jgi:toxin ParE1/3/4